MLARNRVNFDGKRLFDLEVMSTGSKNSLYDCNLAYYATACCINTVLVHRIETSKSFIELRQNKQYCTGAAEKNLVS